MSNILINDTDKLDKGFLIACDAVTKTLGAEGKLALLDNQNNPPITTKDGVSVMQKVRLTNKTENFGALQAISGALVTLEKAGDSTTTTAAFMQGYIRNLKRSKFNKKVEKGIKLGVKEVNEYLNNLATIASDEDIERIIHTSVNNDSKLSDVIYDAYINSGKTGVIEVVQNSNITDTTFTVQNGMYLDSHGYASPFFLNREDKASFDAENVAVLCFATWDYDQHVINLIKSFCMANGREKPLIVFFERPNSDTTEELLKMKQLGFNICQVNVNGYDEFESETLLNDIALLTGARVYNPREESPEAVAGLADKTVVTLNTTTISVYNTPKAVFEKIEQLEKADSPDERRLKRLKGKVVIIEVAGLNDIQRKEVFDRVEDALESIKSTKEEGFIAGGGSTLVFISNKMNTKQKTKEVQLGYDLVKKVIKEPFRIILDNANRKAFPNWVEHNILGLIDYEKQVKNTYGLGYNAVTDEISNLFGDGIIDSKKSIRTALDSATERAISMFNIGVIVHFPDKLEL